MGRGFRDKNFQVWGSVLAISLCSFALVASEFMPVSLLTPVAEDLSLTAGQAGQAISISGILAVLTSLFISPATQKFDRKHVLLALSVLMIASGIMVSVAPNYSVFMVGRALLGISIGGCWSMSTSVVMRIAPESFVPRAIAVIQGGSALATAVAAPLGSLLGSYIGWRWAFFCVVPLAAIALCWQAVALPSMPGESKRTSPVAVFRLLGNWHLTLGMGGVAFLFMGQFSLFTYLRPFLESVTKANISQISLLLLALGISGLIGTVLVGSIIKRNLGAVLIAIPLLMSLIVEGLVLYGEGFAATALLLGAWGLVATSAPVGWFTWLSKTLPADAEAGGGLMVAVIQLAITIGATVGGALYDLHGYQATFTASALMLILAAVLAAVVSRFTLAANQLELIRR
ncbi:MFS transporter [Pseudomonas viridiflava]|uniref:MFS transporter n=1 Tax=Pseudomonas viridiflava TaxID=33069 RepID=UPI001F1567DA|nr:MFS transporter [Pseudomonas viridiflava]